MKVIQLIITLLLILSTSLVFCQVTPNQLVKEFFDTYKNEGSSIALDNIYKTNSWLERNHDATINLKNEIEGLNVDYVGEFYGYELITEKSISDSYILQSYLVKFDRQPIRYTFQFYKPNDKWKIFGFKYDGNLGAELEESAKIYYINYDK